MVKGGHVPTNEDGNRAHKDVDAFIRKSMSARKSFPFAEIVNVN